MLPVSCVLFKEKLLSETFKHACQNMTSCQHMDTISHVNVHFERISSKQCFYVRRSCVSSFDSWLSYKGEVYMADEHHLLYMVHTEEDMYLRLISKVLHEGVFKMDRTGVGCTSLFGQHLRFNLKNNCLPMLTTKRVFFKGVAKELLWFLKGGTNSKPLEEEGVNVWAGNSSRSYLDSLGFTEYPDGELGPIYGYQWRSWGKPYRTRTESDGTPADDAGIDQIARIIETIRTNPTDRRMILSAWNVGELSRMALPPCHLLSQFYVSVDVSGVKHLSCAVYQRSADMFLGVPFNITSYALLTHMIAYVTGCQPKELVMNFGDIHVYKNHEEQVHTQMKRNGFSFPELHIRKVTTNIDELDYDDLLVEGYTSGGTIKAPMAV